MRKAVVTILLGVALSAGAHAEESADDAQTPACKTAEVNPVTGHVFCIDPLGAEVEPPPASAKPPCEEASRGQWTWAPNCDDVVPEG